MNMNIPENFWKAATAFVVVLIVAAVFGTIRMAKSIGYVGANPNMTNTITVDGTGDAYAKPDVATFSFTVSQTAPTVVDAQTKADNQANSAIKAVKDAGVSDNDIQTTSYSINPHYQYQNAVCPSAGSVSSTVYCPPGRQVLTGYDVSESVQVKVRDLTKAGAIFSSIGSLGVQNVNGLDFSIDKPESVQAQARSKAISQAQSKAQELAREIGVSLVRVTSFYESNGPIPVVYGLGGAKESMTAAPMSAPAPDIATGQQKVTSSVTITYEIK